MNNPTETTGDIIAKLERDLKSAMEEIERKSFALHGLERENAALLTRCEKAEQEKQYALTEIDRQSFMVQSLQAENAALRTMLKRLQWAAENYEEPACPICWCEEPIHEDDCALAALLKGDDNAPTTETP